MFSFFIDQKTIYVYTKNFAKGYQLNEQRDIADEIVLILRENVQDFSQLNQIFYSLGPMSFTNSRIIFSIIKSLKISYNNIKFIGVSSFLTYLYVILKNNINDNNLLAIPTLRGDYFVAKCKKFKIIDTFISDLDNVMSEIIICENFDKEINLAEYQYLVTFDTLSKNNSNFLQQEIYEINYGFTPEYKH